MAGPDPRSDEQLVDACNAGDAAAFDALYLRHRDWAVRVAHRFTGDRDEAIDVMQESFAYLLSRFPGFVLTARLTSFLYIVIKHNALSGRRKRRRMRLVAAVDDRPVQATAGAAAGAPEDLAALSRLVESLPETHREVLLMRAVDGMSMQEIAGALSIPVGTVKSRLHHALATLRADPAGAAYFGPG